MERKTYSIIRFYLFFLIFAHLMIAFTRLGKMGQFGNQLFQYAFLRTTARRLGVRFYCPEWIGDKIFSLHDQHERATKPVGVDFLFQESQFDYWGSPKKPDPSETGRIFRDFSNQKSFFRTKRMRCNDGMPFRTPTLSTYETTIRSLTSRKA